MIYHATNPPKLAFIFGRKFEIVEAGVVMRGRKFLGKYYLQEFVLDAEIYNKPAKTKK